jgi:transposase
MSYQPLPSIDEALDALRERLRHTRDGDLHARLHLLVLIKTEAVHSRKEAADRLAHHRNTIGRWLAAYQRGGLEALLKQKPLGKPPGQRTLPQPVLEALQQRLAAPEGFASYLEVQTWLRDESGLEIPYKTVHKLVHYDLKAKLKRPRPEHPKKV